MKSFLKHAGLFIAGAGCIAGRRSTSPPAAATPGYAWHSAAHFGPGAVSPRDRRAHRGRRHQGSSDGGQEAVTFTSRFFHESEFSLPRTGPRRIPAAWMDRLQALCSQPSTSSAASGAARCAS